MTSFPLLKRTLAIFRSAEFGFFGVIVRTTKQTPCLCGQASNAGALLNLRFDFRGFLTSWLMVGIFQPFARLAFDSLTPHELGALHHQRRLTVSRMLYEDFSETGINLKLTG